ncbi:LOW QUALITY PROTEIN: splicing regulatory glutamine/lysine-rich protein 1 [Drosophila gunungcola]|uniref:LOW QUALITY PROTEIN: splicing regulatory glutamine/lysine-rich protein 1 n=1 Tax=Drosophila gunungcola TaxID=103775 RepID=UPI0022E7F156|nr:LOW QUALITY PROTEIN: splicing regulatory glutamine/lysine-rich protein 1 [Drosophila gunungcola]
MNRILWPSMVTDPSRRIPGDVFHGDPFKIQSYNFRYADKPFYPIQNYQRPSPPAPPPLVTKPSFQTFYHNPRFSQDPEYIPAKRSLPTCSVSEHRKRRLQLDSKGVPLAQQTRRPPIPSTVTDSPLLRSCCQSGEYQTMRRDQSSTTLRSNGSNHLRATGGGIRKASATTFCRGSNTRLQTKRSACSGCEIDINICSVDPQSEVDNNVSIKIEADAYLLNNTDRVKPHKEQSSSSRCTGAFGIDIDKRLSKFNVSETKPRTSPEWDLRQKEKVREDERRRQLREDLRLERERERQEERERARQRERDREHLRQLERQRDRERLLELEEERERHRLRELERESQRCREFHRLCVLQQQLHREEAKPLKPRPPVPMTSHLCAVTSDDRLPGMAYCDLPSRRSERSEVSRRKQPVPRERQTAPFGQKRETVASATLTYSPRSSTPPPIATSRSSSPTGSTNCSSSRSSSPIRNTTIPRNLDRSTSGTSNGNVHVTVTSNGVRSSCSMSRSSNARVSEPKQLNGSQPLVTSLNSMPIRITTSRTTDRDLAFSMNHVRMRGSSPSVARQDACQVKIDVFADNLRMMRL